MAFQVKIHQIRAFVEVARQGKHSRSEPNVEYVATGTE